MCLWDIDYVRCATKMKNKQTGNGMREGQRKRWKTVIGSGMVLFGGSSFRTMSSREPI
jgi:hypothetical protein